MPRDDKHRVISGSGTYRINYTVDVTVAVTRHVHFLAETSKWANEQGERGVENNTKQRWLNPSAFLVLLPVTQAGSPQ